MHETIAGIILAGGLSRRMGGDKPLARLNGRLLIEHVADGLRPQVDLLAINANGDPDRFAPLGLPVVADTVEGHPGPLAGVLAGLEWASTTHASRLLTAAADTPFLPGDLAEKLLRAVRHLPDAIAVARSGAASLTELSHFGLPSILIPYPHAAEDHQTLNARIFERGGAALLLPEHTLSGQALAEKLLECLDNPARLSDMSACSARLAPRDAAERVVEIILSHCRTT